MSVYGMTREGFRIKRETEISKETFDELEALWGPIKRNPESVIGQIVGVLSKPPARLWMQLEGLYMSMDPDSAEGILLDNICRYKLINRKEPTGTTVICSAYGTEGTVVLADKLVSDVNGNNFGAAEDTAFTSGEYNDVTIKFPVTSGSSIREITISSGGMVYTSSISAYSFDLWATDFATEIQDAVDNELLPYGFAVDVDLENSLVHLYVTGYNDFNVYDESELELSDFGYPIVVICTETGPIYVSSGEVDSIVDAVPGWDSVYNFNNGLTGADWETDNVLRIRRRRSKRTGSNNTDAIAVAIENSVQGVRSVTVYENDQNYIVDGLEPHSIFAVVDGGDGREQDIAETIWKKKGTGITTNGDVERTITDEKGFDRLIKFARPETVYGWVRVDVTSVDPDKSLPVNWDQLIQSAILATGGTFEIGDDFVSQRFYGGVYGVSGVRTATVEVGTSSSPTVEPTNWTTGYIEMDKTQKVSVASKSNISVTGSF